MAKFSTDSIRKLQQCHPDLQRIFEMVIVRFDCTILTGHRSQPEQDQAHASGRSKKRWPDSKHNAWPSKAIDAAPYPIDWQDRERFNLFAGYVLATADHLGVKLRWGGDWNRDTMVKDNAFDDLVHFEIA